MNQLAPIAQRVNIVLSSAPGTDSDVIWVTSIEEALLQRKQLKMLKR